MEGQLRHHDKARTDLVEAVEGKVHDHVADTDKSMKLLRQETMRRIAAKEDSSEKIIQELTRSSASIIQDVK